MVKRKSVEDENADDCIIERFGKVAEGGFSMGHRKMEEGSGLKWEGKPVRKGTHLWPQPSK